MSDMVETLSSDLGDLLTAPSSGDAEAEASAPLAPSVPAESLAFALDGESRAVIASQLGPDAGSKIYEGDVRTAAEHIAANGSPQLLIVDISESSDPMKDLDALADVCVPGTVLITLGAANDVALYRRLRNAGVADYLVKPLTTDLLTEALAAALSPQAQLGEPQTVQGKLVCFVNARGGSGASTLATNTAAVLAREKGKKVGLIDLDLQFGTIALLLDVEASRGLREALEDPERVDGMFVEGVASPAGERLSVMATEEGISEPAFYDPENAAMFLSMMRQHFDVVLVDVPLHDASRLWPVLSGASKLVIVTDLSLAGLRDTGRLLTAAKDAIEPSRMMLVANRVGADKHGNIDQSEFERALDRKFDFVVPDDPKAVGAAARAGKPVVDMAKDGKMLGALRKLCGSLVRSPVEDEEAGEKKKKKRKFSLFRGKDK